MLIPRAIPGLRWATVLVGAYGFVWIALEGDLWRVTVLGLAVTAVALLTAVQRILGGRALATLPWLAVAALSGLLWGAGSVAMILFLMAVKTGLHAHGPEFTPLDVAGVWSHLPLWSLVGLLLGLGVGLIVAAVTSRQESV